MNEKNVRIRYCFILLIAILGWGSMTPILGIFEVAQAEAASPTKGDAPATVEASTILEIKIANKKKSYSVKELLAWPKLEHLEVDDDATYGRRKIMYSAIPFEELIKSSDLGSGDSLTFTCRDGFSASLDKELLYNSGGQPMLAIEDPEHPWPPLPSRKGETAGPFYLIWKNAARAHVGREEWPFQITRFETQTSISTRFPRGNPELFLLQPAKSGSTSLTEQNKRDVREGYTAFLKNCFVCHQFNGQGPSTMGPDLNIPENPTEYLKPEALRKQIRDPQSVKRWSQGKMSGFSQAVLPDAEMEQIISYLDFMKTHKSNGK